MPTIRLAATESPGSSYRRKYATITLTHQDAVSVASALNKNAAAYAYEDIHLAGKYTSFKTEYAKIYNKGALLITKHQDGGHMTSKFICYSAIKRCQDALSVSQGLIFKSLTEIFLTHSKELAEDGVNFPSTLATERSFVRAWLTDSGQILSSSTANDAKMQKLSLAVDVDGNAYQVSGLRRRNGLTWEFDHVPLDTEPAEIKPEKRYSDPAFGGRPITGIKKPFMGHRNFDDGGLGL